MNKNTPVQTPLLMAVLNNDIQQVKQLIDSGANVNERGKLQAIDNFTVTPLLVAARSGFVEIVKLLLQAGVDVNAKGYYSGSTALILAITSSNKTQPNFLEILDLLLKAGADVNIGENDVNYTPLFFAANFNKLKVVQILLDAGASVEQKIGRRLNTSVYEMALAGKPFKPTINKFIVEYVQKKRQRAANVSKVFSERISNLPETGINPEGKLPQVAANRIAEFNTGLVRNKGTPIYIQAAAAGGHGGRRKIRKTRKGKKGTRKYK